MEFIYILGCFIIASMFGACFAKDYLDERLNDEKN